MIEPIKSLNKLYSGKVRELYDIDSNIMLMIASDRISTFDVILNQNIPNKGIYLTQISLFWFKLLESICKNHLTGIELTKYLSGDELDYANGRGIIVQKLQPIPIEVIVRGYLAGTGYKDYLKTGSICGIKLPPSLKNAQKLPEPIFTPSTKAKVGDHDENITLNQCRDLIGDKLTTEINETAIKLYKKASDLALQHNIIIADTKFEFGLNKNNELILMDEVLTPDSSRFWDLNNYEIGKNPSSFDKQFLRDYLELEIKWNKLPPIPDLPNDIINKTAEKYLEIIHRFGINY